MAVDGCGEEASTIVLASGSPQRRALLERVGVAHRVVVSDVPEGADPVANARRKAEAVWGRLGGRPAAVVAADTEVVVDGRAQGKPVDREDAADMLRSIAGRSHHVVTAWVLRRASGCDEGRETVRVTMRPYGEGELAWYLATEEWRGRAGGYAIQGAGGALVAAIDGDVSAVIGLPLGPVLAALARADLGPWAVGGGR